MMPLLARLRGRNDAATRDSEAPAVEYAEVDTIGARASVDAPAAAGEPAATGEQAADPTPIADMWASSRRPDFVQHGTDPAAYDGGRYDAPPSSSRRSGEQPSRTYGAAHGSPEEDEHNDQHSASAESSSSGDRTKVGSISESRSPSGYKVRGGYGGGSDHSHHDGDYAGAVPLSPSSSQNGLDAAGRYRQASYGSGFESNRGSQLGDGPYLHSSRTALNNDWRGSGELADGIHVAPSRDRFYGRRHDSFDAGELALLESEKQPYMPLPPPSPSDNTLNEKAGAFDEKAPLPGDDRAPPVRPDGKAAPEPAIILSRANRLAWIDGLRGLASLMIFTHHFADLTWSSTHPDTLEVGTFDGFLRNGQLAVGIYFLLGGRVLAHSFLRSAYSKPRAPVKDVSGVPSAAPPKASGPKWLSLSSSLFRRSIRLALPAIVIGFVQWQVASSGLVHDAPIEATTQVLSPSALWEPAWGNIGNFAGFLQFSLDLFTNYNSMYMLSVGSALWTTYYQFWGSVLVYIVAAVMAPLPFRGRQVVYGCLALSYWYFNSPNFLYLVGLWLSDLHASGFVRRIQDHWKPTILIELAVMAVALALIGGGKHVAAPADRAFASFTVYEGKFGFDPDTNWPQLMYFSNWFPAVAIMIWLELSHAMQWFISWRLFTWLGKVSYGFYLCQFLTFYGIMPHLVLTWARQGKTYWSIVAPSYIVCLLANLGLAWISYHALDRVGLKLGKWVWDGLFVTKPKNAAALPLKMVRAFGHMLIHGPGDAWKAVSSNTASGASSLRRNAYTLFHWRTPTVRPPVPDPTDPDMLAQLHSTRWTADLSQDREAMRTYRLLRWQQWSWVPHLFIIPGVTFIWTWFHPTGDWTYDALTISTLWRFVWVLSVPNCLAALFGFVTPDWAPTAKTMARRPVTREYIRNFFIVLVTKGSNETAVRRGYNVLLKLERYHPAVKVIVLTDEPYVYPDLKNIVCPKSYKSPLNKAKYKARALDYFRYHVSLGVYDWILHCDEESTCDAETVRRCFEFIRYTWHHFGQGVILYNGEGYWDNWLFTVADGIRVGDDLARFHFQNSVVKRPIFGVHGSFLMTNGEMENECTWDFGSLAEDFEFSQDAWRRGFTCGRIHGIMREQSPTTVRDFAKQRRRWFMGIRDIKGMYGLPHLAINLWTIGVFTLAVTLINLPFIVLDNSLTPLWVAISANFCFVTFFTIYIWGILFQDIDAGVRWYLIPVHLICAIPIQPFASILEAMSAIWAMSSVDFGKFEVIQKR